MLIIVLHLSCTTSPCRVSYATGSSFFLKAVLNGRQQYSPFYCIIRLNTVILFVDAYVKQCYAFARMRKEQAKGLPARFCNPSASATPQRLPLTREARSAAAPLHKGGFMTSGLHEIAKLHTQRVWCAGTYQQAAQDVKRNPVFGTAQCRAPVLKGRTKHTQRAQYLRVQQIE